MSPDQANSIQNMTGVVSVIPETHFRLHTTHSPQFLGLTHKSGLWKDSNYGKGIIIGVLDTGTTPQHPSFHDTGVPPPPARWKGRCEVGVKCNNKLIGMRSFVKKTSPVDEVGHGTHTSSTVAGNFVDDANILGNMNGTAAGIAPLAHLAMYRVCNHRYCSESDSIAGMDAAIGDGVDVLSISLGGSSVPFYRDAMGISTFSAIQKGIFVSCSAGNSGPSKSTLSNEAPWVLTVGASTIDRRIRTTVYLGNEKLLDGESLYQPKSFPQKVMRPLVYPGVNGDFRAAICSIGSLDDVHGKVVVCDMGGKIPTVGKGVVVKNAGGAAMILVNGISCPESTVPEDHVLPASNVGYKEGIEIKNYLNNHNSSPVATILQRGTVLGVKSAPEVACFSSRGPNKASPGILKPDIIGPGVDILAAWPSMAENNKPRFEILSGTSMACPHLAGVAALLKSNHPEWSPAAIKSAMMTTTIRVSLYGKPIVDERDLPANMFATGAGHVDPSKANDPGLVFDIQPDDYIPYLCGLGYTTKQITTIVKKPISCVKSILEADLNYPSMVVSLLKSGDRKTYSRTVTNVGMANSIYTIGNVSVPCGVRMVVDGASQRLRFVGMHQKLTYRITFTRDKKSKLGLYGQGYMTWVSGKYSVTTPFLFKLLNGTGHLSLVSLFCSSLFPPCWAASSSSSFSFPFILETLEFLTEKEKHDPDKMKEFEVKLVGPRLQVYEKSMAMKMWCLRCSNSYVLGTNWNEFVKENDDVLKEER
ncbi:hypothetical protein LXL04_019080 [Taraxacum kok-saghyz]